MKNTAAQALRAIPSEKRAKASRENGKKGGRPTYAELIQNEIDACYREDGEMSAAQENCTYMDGLLFALRLFRK